MKNSTKLRLTLGAIVLSLICLVALILRSPSALSPSENSEEDGAADSRFTNTSHQDKKKAATALPHPLPVQDDPRLNRLSDGRVEYNQSVDLSKKLGGEDSEQTQLIILAEIFGHYQYCYKENPVGVANSEFTEQLLGDNPMKIIFISPDSPAVSDGELVDSWGTPYFFHAISAKDMQIISAGPDLEMFTEDDLSLSEQNFSQ